MKFEISEELEFVLLSNPETKHWVRLLALAAESNSEFGIVKLSPNSNKEALDKAVFFDGEYLMLYTLAERTGLFFVFGEVWVEVDVMSMHYQEIINSERLLVVDYTVVDQNRLFKRTIGAQSPAFFISMYTIQGYQR